MRTLLLVALIVVLRAMSRRWRNADAEEEGGPYSPAPAPPPPAEAAG